MPPCSTPVRRERHRMRARGLALTLLGALLLGGCSSDDASPTTSGTGARSPAEGRAGRTTDPGSRFLDAAAPLGGLTVETPPVAVPQERAAPAGPP